MLRHLSVTSAQIIGSSSYVPSAKLPMRANISLTERCLSLASASYDMCLNRQPPHFEYTSHSLTALSGDGVMIVSVMPKQ